MRISDWSSDVCSSDLTPQALVALDDAAVALARDLRVDRIEYRLREALHPDWPCNRETYVTFRKEIAREVEQNMLAIPRKQRAMVRKGIKDHLAEEIDPDVRRLYPLYAASVRNLGTPVIGQRYFERSEERRVGREVGSTGRI